MSEKSLDELLDTTRYCYWLDQSEPDHVKPDRFRVCLVFENEPGYRPTGGGGVEPWCWNKATCERMNEKKLGLTPEEANRIVASSMFSHSTN